MPVFRVTLAPLLDPEEVAGLERCDEEQTARAIAVVSARTARRRAALSEHRATGPLLERLLGTMRRLESPQLAGYKTPAGVLLSEPFGAVPSAIEPAPLDRAAVLVSALLRKRAPRVLVAALARFGCAALESAVRAGIRAVIVPRGRPFSQCSRCVASLVPDIDRWQAPPAGLFVLEERLLLLRPDALRMAAAHEFAHALDAVLARRPRSYFSFESDEVRSAFAGATSFVNEYAASGLDEYFAECVRAYVEVNDDRSSWLPLTRQSLHERDPRMFGLIERLFTNEFC